MSSFFRKEALAHQKHKLDGSVIIATPMSFHITLALIVCIVLTTGMYLFWAEYHRKEVVAGYLRPATGVSKVYATASGIVDEVYVKEGDVVEKGQPLARIRLDRQLGSGAGLNEAIINELLTQKHLLETNLHRRQALYQVHDEKLTAQIRNIKAQHQQALTQQDLLRERLRLSVEKHDDIQKLVERGFVGKHQLDTQQDTVLTIRQQLQDINTHILAVTDELNQFHYQHRQLPIEHQQSIADLQSELAGINQQISQADAQRSFDVVSNRGGAVTSLLVKDGMMAHANQPLMSILPEEAPLEAVLFVPTRAYGFVTKGQSTRIRYQAFPYQRFGIYEGQISAVAKSVLLPNETALPVSFNEPVYQVVVTLAQQNIMAYGVTVSLQSGMLLEADIMVDNRSLLEWLFEPIFSIQGAV
ncbi:HlyD family efflux transporter periplasmic adaptor subunit [Alteromonas sp. C1M14]|uniref:HlyD family secretion protein n=1 Tax=Alteromonas sp. C1M14 TaxID=2841567 RepID=UPI001C0A0D8F|nr:HlyD family efflux transporter periplasmic adaptor subunit [Alteromonas sp. C1M14]MBU2977519.1 HlyD family efflux transporter periplasmic adaptor subunit [Alteromonas sp. C1M14]